MKDIGPYAKKVQLGLSLVARSLVSALPLGRRTERRLQTLPARFGIAPGLDRAAGEADNRVQMVTTLEDLRALAPGGRIVCRLTPENAAFADDLLLGLQQSGRGDCLFQPSPAALPGGLPSAKESSAAAGSAAGSGPARFTPAQLFHLVGFFDRLARQIRGDPEKRFYYQQVAAALSAWDAPGADGAARFSPAGPGPLPPGELLRMGGGVALGGLHHATAGAAKRRKPRRSTPRLVQPPQPAPRDHPQDWERVLITGWYGTETAGDKAILAELLHFLKSYNPGVRIAITSIDPKHSRQTNRELQFGEQIEIVAIENAQRAEIWNGIDAVILGGGPLMDARQIEDIARLFERAADRRVARVIFGCGIGPIRSEVTRGHVSAILRLATSGFVRDRASRDLALQLGAGPALRAACDPSLAFLSRWRLRQPERQRGGPLRLAGLLRAQTAEYYPANDLVERNRRFAQELAETFARFSDCHHGAQVELLPMHSYGLGNDDRLFNRAVERAAAGRPALEITREYLELEGLLERIYRADACVAMRYHGHLFALALGIPFLSINYTGRGGKVGNLITRIGHEAFREEFDSFDARDAAARLERLVENRDEIGLRLTEVAQELAAQLEQTYFDLYGGAVMDASPSRTAPEAAALR